MSATTQTLPEGWTYEQMTTAILEELCAEPATPISAAELGRLVGLDARTTGGHLRVLRNQGLADWRPATPGSQIRLWIATGAQRAGGNR